MGDIITATLTKYYIGPAGTSSQYDTIAEFEAVSAWTEILQVENGGEFGDEAASVTGATLGDGRIRKAKGARDAGTLALICFHDPFDTGQVALEAAEQTSDNYTFKVVLNDGAAGYSNTIYYFRGLVMSRRSQVNTNDSILRKTFNIGINSEVFTDPSST